MKLFFWLVLLAAVLKMPVTAEVHIRLERGIHYRIRIKVAGIQVLRQKENSAREKKLQTAELMKERKSRDYRIAIVLFRKGGIRQLLNTMRWQNTQVQARISFEDAALTAVVYALVHNVLQDIKKVRQFDSAKIDVEADFRGIGTILIFRGIAFSSLGKLLEAAIRFGVAVLADRIKRWIKEEKYAASH